MDQRQSVWRNERGPRKKKNKMIPDSQNITKTTAKARQLYLCIVSPFVCSSFNSWLPRERVKSNGFPPSFPPSSSISTAARLFGAKLFHSRPIACFPPILFPLHLYMKLTSALNPDCFVLLGQPYFLGKSQKAAFEGSWLNKV